MRFPFGAIALFLSFTPLLSLRAQVVVNEISSVQSARLLQKPAGALPRLGALPAWHENDFAVPPWWGSGSGPFGFGYTQATNVQTSMLNKTPVLYLRRAFTATAAQAASVQQLQLLIDYDDGFVAYLNGVEVARRNTGAVGSFAWHDQPAFNVKTATGAETIALGTASSLLRAGANVLAIQVHNNAVNNSQFFCSATLRIGGASPVNLVLPGDNWNWFPGTHEPAGGLYDGADFAAAYALGPDWTQPNYADGAWANGAGGFGFDAAPDYLPQIGTDLIAMRNVAVSVYLRREFTLTPSQFEGLTATTLTVDWDDGYVLYLNGYELSRANVAGGPGTFVPFDQSASNHGASRDNGLNDPALIVTIPVPKNLLRSGRNVISAQLHNAGSGSSDLLLDLRFSGTSGGSPLTFVAPGSTWKYKVATSEVGTPAPPVSDLIAPEFLDWIELKNTSAAVVDLSGWTVTDDADEPAKWAFPAGTSIAADGFLVVACSGRNVTAPAPGGLLHTNFSLNSKGEYIGLSDATGLLQSQFISVPDQDAFHTWGTDPGSGQPRFLDRGTPGAANAPGTASDITAEVDFDKATGFYPTAPVVTLSTATPGATIRYTLDGSEPTSATGTLYTGPFMPTVRPPIGPGAGTILKEFFQWSNGTFVPPPSFPPGSTPTNSQLLTLLETPSGVGDWYTHRVRGYLHPPQSGAYEFWLATDDDGELWLSTTDNPAQKQRIAYITGNWAAPREWFKIATQHSAPRTLVAGQRYYLEVLQSEGSGGDNLAVGWSGPGLPAGVNVIDGRYLSPPATLPPGTTQPPGFGTVRASAFSSGRLPSEVRTRNYVSNADARLTTVPAIFLSGPAAETFYSPNGIFAQVGGNWNTGSWVPNDAGFDYNFCLMNGDAFERPAMMEIVNPGNQLVERTTVGARFSGSPWSRPQYQLQSLENSGWNFSWVSKPQINVFFRDDFGIARLHKNGFIPKSSLNEWDELRLRAGKNDAHNPFIVDEWTRRIFAGMGAPAPQGFNATLFVNGHFKSYFNLTERVREPFFREFYGSGNPWDVNFIGEWESGDGVAFAQMESFFRNNDFTTLANYQQGATFWDMTNVADYFILNAWAAVQDWPHNNYAFARERAAGAKWVFSMWDAEGAIGLFGQANTHNTFVTDLAVNDPASIGSESRAVALVFRRAYQNAEFKLLFADRLQKHFRNGGVMTRPYMQARWDELRNEMTPLIAAVTGGGFQNSFWDQWANRDPVFLQQCRDLGMWPTVLAPNVTPFGGTGTGVTMSNPNGSGTIYYTTNDSDPRAVGGAIQGTAYSTAIPITTPFRLKARVRSTGGVWSPIVEADFAPGTVPRVVITEIHYNPPGPDDATEFLELTNVGNTAASLNGAHFTEGIGFTFGNVTLGAGQSLVLVKDPAAFAAAYPGVPIAGVFTGALDNSGETLTLRDIVENVIVSVTYGDGNVAGWPVEPDGDGRTLVLRRQFNPNTDPALAASWRSSVADGGQPGSADSTVFVGNANADLDGDGYNALVEYGCGSSDSDAASKPQLTMSRDVGGHALLSFTHPVAADDVTLDALETIDLSTWQPAILESEIADAPGILRATWRSQNAGPKVFARLRARLN